MHAARGNVVGVAGQVAKAAMEEAHARACEQGRWVLNEKRLIAGSGLGGLADCFVRIPRREVDLALWVDEVARALEA
jgi:hypothetical protein